MLNAKKRKKPSTPRTKAAREVAGEFGLTPRQRAFADHYLVDNNASAAYLKAGYVAKNDNVAWASSSALLRSPKVATYIESRLKKLHDRLEITQERVLAEVARLAYFDIGKCYGADGKLLALKDMDEDTRRALSQVEIEMVGDTVSVKKVRGHDKHSALEKLMRYLQLFKDVQVPQGGLTLPLPPPGQKLDISVKLSPEESYRRMLEV